MPGGAHRWEAEQRLQRLREELLPRLDRASRMAARNLKVLDELRRAPVLAVAIGWAEQVNVAQYRVRAIVLEQQHRGLVAHRSPR